MLILLKKEMCSHNLLTNGQYCIYCIYCIYFLHNIYVIFYNTFILC